MTRATTLDMRRVAAKPRTLVLCFDGTTNIFDDTNTNVVKLFSLLKRDNHEEQMIYYQPGVGTYVPPGMLLPITLRLARIADQGIALYLDKHVMGGYEFLMKHYRDGDKICLFGFSRGAYTARALAGMLHKVGLLPPDNVEQIPFAYSNYTRSDQAGFEESAGFKKTFCREVSIEFMGVWDTVSSVGVILPRQLPFTKSNPIVRTFRHAVSLDERRAKFKDHLWHAHSPGGQCANSSKRDQPTKAGVLPSPTAPTDSPVVGFQPLSTLHESNSKEIIDFEITDATPSTDCETISDTAVSQPPLWVEARDEAFKVSSPGKDGQIQAVSPNKPWHSQERTYVELPNSSIEKEKAKQLDTLVASEKHIVASEMNRAQHHHRLGWASRQMCSRPTNKQDSVDSCGETEYEETLSAQCQSNGPKDKSETNVLEVWFAGCHSDVGGGSEKDTKKHQLSNISLRWMIRQIILSQCGIKFNEEDLKRTDTSLEILRSSMGVAASQSSPSSNEELVNAIQEQDRNDAFADLHDNLRHPGWWPLEFFPLFHTPRDQTGDSHIKFKFNLFRGRRPHGKIKVHSSVLHRIHNKEAKLVHKYKYRARVAETNIEWVD